MTDNSRTVAATLIGAGLGAIAGYLSFTDRGRKLRHQIDQALGEAARELDHTRHTLDTVLTAVRDGGTPFDEEQFEPGIPSRRPRSADRPA